MVRMKQGQIYAKLFLEGIEVPFTGATITSTVGQAMIAYIDVVPHGEINNIKPRTMVHISVLDYRTGVFATAFEGEVFGFNFSKTATSRNVTLQCIDFSSYWDNVLTYFFNAQQNLSGGTDVLSRAAQDIKTAESASAKTITTSYSISSFYRQVMDSVKGDFLDGVVELYKKISEINDFYQLAEDRLKIQERIFLKSSGELTNLLKQKEGQAWYEGIMGGYNGFSTLRHVINDLMGLVFHDFVSPAFPSKINGKPAQFVFKPNMFMLPPPMCNVVYPDEYSSFTYNRNFFQEPTRMSYKPEMPMYGGAGTVALGCAYAPQSYDYYMFGSPSRPDIGNGPLQARKDYGHYGNKDDNETNNNKKREGQFLTNEELMKGILLATETMMPASTQFTEGLAQDAKASLAKKIANYLFFKKRFQNRECQITSHLKLSVVPGFTVLIVDDSEADQNVIAYCNSVTHRIYATQGGYTNCNLSYARTVGEQDQTSDNIGEPLLPPWFSREIFGESKGSQVVSQPTYVESSTVGNASNMLGEVLNTDLVTKAANAATKAADSAASTTLKVGAKLSEFYSALIGVSGSQSITGYTGTDSAITASKKIVSEYKMNKKKRTVDILIQKATTRNYITITESFKFLGASPSTKNMFKSNVDFTGARISGVGYDDQAQIAARKAVVVKYRNALRDSRAFKG